MNIGATRLSALVMTTILFTLLASGAGDCTGQVTYQPYGYQAPVVPPPGTPLQGSTYGTTQPTTPVVGFQSHSVQGNSVQGNSVQGNSAYGRPASASYFTPQGGQVGSPYPQPSNQQPTYQQQGYSPQAYPQQPYPPATVPGMQPTLPPFAGLPTNALPADIVITVPQTRSGRFMLGANYSSDNELVGELIIDERNFDITRWPRSFADAFGPTAWKGNGQSFRVEAVPGNDLQRYLISFSDPFFLGSQTSFSVSGYYYERHYPDWREKRSGGRIAIGRKLSNYLSLNAGLRMEGVTMDEPRVDTSTQLNDVLGYSNLFLASVGFVYDTRFSPYMADEGTYFAMSFIQAFDDYSYSRGEIEYRHHRLIYRQTPTSGAHTLNFRWKAGFSESAPVFESYIAGGASTIRGFEFRGISPIEGGVRVGGRYETLSSAEYQFPLTCYDNHYHGVVFVDYGSVEESVKFDSKNYRVAPGVGLRIDLPWAGLGAPLAFDWAFPVATGNGDIENTFSFFVGLMR